MNLPIRFVDRRDAGRRLAEVLRERLPQSGPALLVLGLPRGGVPVAAEVAAAFDAELDVLIVRKLGFPHQPEVAMGAIASGGVIVANESLLARSPESREAFEPVKRAERTELERRELLYRGERPWPEMAGRTVVVVDDGLATGATMRAAIAALQRQGAARVIAAVPVAPPSAAAALRDGGVELVTVMEPEGFGSVGEFYDDFLPTSDEEVRESLASFRSP